MCKILNYEQILRTIFIKSVEAVKPKIIFNKEKCMELLCNGGDGGDACGVTPTANICSTESTSEELLKFTDLNNRSELVNIKNKHCHLIGFGKGVLGMAVQVEQILGDRLKSGILSLPIGTMDKFRSDCDMKLKNDSCIKIYEGAENNLPDKAAERTAKVIFDFVSTLSDTDVLIVLITGGGSALLPLPIAPITLHEKQNLIKLLVSKGATINELNTVRINMSNVKGGKLAGLAKNSHKIISLIISDVIGDPLDIIASGPTCIKSGQTTTSLDILKKYNLWIDLNDSVKNVITEQIIASKSFPCDIVEKKSSTFIIANNKLAIDAACSEAKSNQFKAIYVSSEVQGNVITLANTYIDFVQSVVPYLKEEIYNEDFEMEIRRLRPLLKIRKEFDEQFNCLLMEKVKTNGICFIFGGEPIVQLNTECKGVGGRSQELALRFAKLCYDNKIRNDITLLCGGTDGIDGPTSAAGAIGNARIIEEYLNELNVTNFSQSIDDFLNENNSYNFYNKLSNGKYHLITGHSGTNVMDLHILFIPTLNVQVI